MATRSGTNSYHATLFEFFRNSDLDAKLWDQVGAKNPFRRNDYGFTLSGPLIKNRLFFLSNFESLRDRTTAQEIGSSPTLAMRSGDFTGQPHIIYDPLTRVFNSSGLATGATPFPGNMVPSSRFDPITQKLLVYDLPPNVATTAYVNNYIRQALITANTDQFTQRIDFTQNDKMNWFGRYSFDNDFVGQGTLYPLEAGGVTTNTWQAVLANTYILGPATVNEFRLAAIHFSNLYVGHFAYKSDVAAALGIPGLPDTGAEDWGLPAQSITGFSGYGETSPAVTQDTTFQVVDNISLTRGAHTLKFGVEIRRDRYDQSGNQRGHGEFDFDGDATDNPGAAANLSGFSFADFLIGNVESADRTEDLANAMFRSTSVYAFAQDDWKITRKVSLSVGLRYETMQPWTDKYCGFANAYVTTYGVGPNGNGLLPNAAPPILVRPCGTGSFYTGVPFEFAAGVQTSTSTSLMGRSLVQHDWLDFAPRLGIAWNPHGDTTVRASVGRIYAQDTGNPVYDMGRNLTGTDLFVHNPQTVPDYMVDPWANENPSTVAGSGQCGAYTGTCLVGSAMYADQYNRRTPYVDEWTANFQQPVAHDLLLEVGYIGSEGHFLQRLTNLNQPVLRTGLTDTRTIAQRSPWPAYGRFNYDNGIVNSNYNGFSAKLTRRLTNGLTMLAAFTWAHSLDDGSAIRNISPLTLPQNTYDLKPENYGSSTFDQRERFVASVVYLLPVGKGQKFLNRGGIVNGILGGWQLGSIVSIMDGLPTTIDEIGDVDSLNQNGNYPNATGISPFPKHPTPQHFWNSAAFDWTNPDLYYQIGNTGINTLLCPHTRNWDFSAVKNFRFRERHNIEFRFESFNFSNHPNWITPNYNLLSASFGVVTASNPMRQLQFALKYSF